MKHWDKIKEIIKKAPKAPGVYVFYEKRSVLYIGKASSLRNRLKSYLKAGDFKNDRLMENATNLKLATLRSEIEALIEEAKLIKEHNPPYNVLWRDDKTYFYAAITKEKFPKIFVVHKNAARSAHPRADFVGPFTEGRALRLVLKMLRRYFPYCTCPKPHLRDCLNAQIGNCSGFCCKKDGKAPASQSARYRKNIRIIKNFLVGKPLGGFAKNLEPEEKTALEKILAHREFLENFDSVASSDYKTARLPDYLIECYDISHLAGKETVAGMTAWMFGNGRLSPRKDFWRKFIIRTAKPGDDPAAIYEALSRRLKHPEWPYPNLVVIDGGAGQFGAAKKAAGESGAGAGIKLISFAKPEQMIYGLGEKPVPLGAAAGDYGKIIPRAISETHDFAVKFHRQRRKKSFLDSGSLW